METNQGESARPPIVRYTLYSIGDEDTAFFIENRKPNNAVRNVVTEALYRPTFSEFLNSATETRRGLPNPRKMSHCY